jgi:thiol-disulfide isomerase/thioredoxin
MRYFKAIYFIVLLLVSISCTQRKYLSDLLPYVAEKEITIVFISSDFCGYCLLDIPFNLELFKKYGDKVDFISLYDNVDLSADEVQKRTNNGLMSSKDIPWAKHYSAQATIDKLWRKKLFPQVHVYVNGKHHKAFIGATQRNKQELEATIKKYSSIK